MRSFKSKVLSAAAWAVPALAAVLPPNHHPSVPQTDGRSSILDFDLQNEYAQATFSVPCAGCLGQDSDDESSLVLNFKTHASEQACGTTSNITLNGIYLPQEWNGDIASGSGSFSGIPDIEENAWFLQHDLDLEWESACLHGENKTATEEEDQSNDAAQVFTVTIKGIDGKPIRKPAGFTISFKQLSPPELLRLEVVPNHDATKKDHAEEWREPPARLRLILPSDEKIEPSDIPNQLSIEDDIRELRALQAEVHKLHGVIKTKQEHINRKLKKEAHNFKEELQQCDSIACVVKTIAHKAHGAWRVLYIRFRPVHHHRHPPPPPPHHGPPMGHEDEYAHVWRAGNHKQAPEAAIHVESLPPPPPPPHGFPPPPPPPPPPHGPHGFHHGPPPPHGHHGPPPSPLIITLKVLVGVLCCGCLFTVIRHKCSSLRTRTERAAAREERRNARAYRRAARRHAWTKWWSRNRRDEERQTDYEEKRALIQEQESVLEEAMQEEIRQLRAAHGVVNSLVTAEEGRSHACCSTYMRCHCHAHPPTPAPYSPISSASIYTSSSLAELPSRPLSRTNSLPEYMSDTSSAPPAYVEDEDTSDVVANGFRQYTPSTTSSSSSTSSRWTPDSSVIDVSPRPSAETLRYAEVADTSQFAETTETGVGGDTKN